ncbi:MAG: hypothetical protein IPK19_28980 [Chloroflexi bacterium]|nr:hypothetical protein [Chloroflexota bacterium]
MSLYDRPSLEALIDAVRLHLETAIIPLVKGDPRLYFQTLVAANVLKIAARESALGWAHLQAAWESMNRLQGVDTPLPGDPVEARDLLTARRADLAGAIRAGEYDDRSAALLDHLLEVTRLQLEVANPRLLDILDAEDLAEDHIDQ